MAVLLIACSDCEDTYVCEGLSDSHYNLIPKNIENKIFESTTDSVIEFIQPNYFRTGRSMEECSPNKIAGCDCEYCPESTGSSKFTLLHPIEVDYVDTIFIRGGSIYSGTFVLNDSTIIRPYTRILDRYSSSITGQLQWPPLRLSFLDFSYTVEINIATKAFRLSQDSFDFNAEILESYQTPSKNYSKVLKISTTHSSPYRSSKLMKNVFYEVNDGIVAFEAIDGQMFYLKSR